MEKIFSAIGVLMLVALLSFYGYKTGNLGYVVVCSLLSFVVAFIYHRMMAKTYGSLVVRMVFLLPLELLEKAVYLKDREEFDEIISNHRKIIFNFKWGGKAEGLDELTHLLQGEMLKRLYKIREEKDLPAAYKKAEEANIAILAMK